MKELYCYNYLLYTHACIHSDNHSLEVQHIYSDVDKCNIFDEHDQNFIVLAMPYHVYLNISYYS